MLPIFQFLIDSNRPAGPRTTNVGHTGSSQLYKKISQVWPGRVNDLQHIYWSWPDKYVDISVYHRVRQGGLAHRSGECSY